MAQDKTKNLVKVKETPNEALILNELAHKILGGRTSVFNEKGNELEDTKAIDYEKALEDYEKSGAPMTELVTIGDKSFTLDHGGTTEQKLALVLADPNINREQKDAVTSLYLFERGKESSSFLMDLFQSRGTMVKESRQFQSRMQFDWEFFVNMFCTLISEQAKTMLNTVLPGCDMYGIWYDALTFLKEKEEEYQKAYQKARESKKIEKFTQKRPTLHDWAVKRYHEVGAENSDDKIAIMTLELGVRYASEAENLKAQMKELITKREEANGKPQFFPKGR